MQRLHTLRSKVRPARPSCAADLPRRPQRGAAQAGFTLIEMMVVIAVLGVLAAAVFAGFRQDDYRNQYERFVSDVEGLLVTARATAIDRQTQVQVAITATTVTVTAFDHTNNTWDMVDFADINGTATGDRELISNNNNVCIYGLQSGVPTPSQASAQAEPSACSSGTQTLQFEPDGGFTDPANTFVTVANSGVTLWIADAQDATNTKLSIIQIFPGGLIRAFVKTGT